MQKLSQVSEKIIFLLVMVLFVFIPLYPKFPLFNVEGTFAAIRLEDLLIFLTVIIWAIYLLFSGKWRDLIKDKLIQALLLFFLIGAVSTFSAIFLTQLVTPHLAILHLLRRVEYMILLPIIFSIISTKKQIFKILFFLILVTILINIIALGQQYLRWPLVSTTNSEFAKGQIIYLTEGARPNSTFAGHYDLAVFLTMVIVFLSAIFFYFRKIIWKILIVLLGGLSFGVLILTAARVSFLATILGVVASFLFIGRKLLILFLIILSVVVLAYPSPLRDRFVSSITIYLEDGGQRFSAATDRQAERSKLNISTLHVANPSPISKVAEATLTATVSSDIVPGEPVDPTELGVYRSFAIRLDVEWPRAIRAFQKNPLLGTGYSSMGLATDNDFLRSLGEVGILGTLAFILIIIEIIKRLMSLLTSSGRFTKYLTAGTLALLIAFILNGVFIDVFEASKVASLFWMFVGLNLAVSRLNND